MTQEALKLALEWAETHGEIVFAGGGMDAVNKMNSWATAIKKALAQPEQDHIPDARKMVTEQEPAIYPEEAYEMGLEEIAFYTTPPQRTWAGLTDEQITQVIKSMPRGIKGWMSDWDLYEFSKAIEAKLKERNT